MKCPECEAKSISDDAKGKVQCKECLTVWFIAGDVVREYGPKKDASRWLNRDKPDVTIDASVVVPSDMFPLGEMMPALPKVLPQVNGKPVCSFCKEPVDYVNMTRGTSKPRIMVVTEPVPAVGIPSFSHNGTKGSLTPTKAPDSQVSIERKVKITAQKVISCPKCIGLLDKPVVVSRV